ncbi:MAG: restriction endonuclease subunit S [Anaerolineales bacterium]|nr:restriction endonuclease subunit S [Anaerolineales bacterium]
MEKRLDPFYYIPELVKLEKKVLSKKPKKLRDYVKSIASGATPKTTESEKYYAEKENGIPFLRVQNLSATGVLDFEDSKYINAETHHGMLKRSQVSAGDLLVKITGVGRMAVASVVPEGFEGNINQHICVIRTGSKEVSETLAAFLNSDIGEKLASRRSTGGTRPALDYPTLLSIPILNDKRILDITKKVVEQKKQNEAEADKLLASIDEYLLNELGIKLPKSVENSLKNRVFIISRKEILDSRFDPNYNHNNSSKNIIAIKEGKHQTSTLSKISKSIFQGVGRNITENSSYILLKVKNIKQNFEIDYEDVESIGDFPINKILNKGDIITPCIGEAVKQVKFSVFNGENNKYLVDNNTGVIRLNENINPDFINYCLCSSIGKLQVHRFIGGGGVPFLGADNLKKFIIPLPPLEKQKEIAKHINSIREQARKLKEKTSEALASASEEIEAILLG